MKIGEEKFIVGIKHICKCCAGCRELMWVAKSSVRNKPKCEDCYPPPTKEQARRSVQSADCLRLRPKSNGN